MGVPVMEVIEARLKNVEEDIQTITKAIEKLTDTLVHLSRTDEKLKTLVESMKSTRDWVNRVEKSVNEIEKRCAERSHIYTDIEEIKKQLHELTIAYKDEHDNTLNNSFFRKFGTQMFWQVVSLGVGFATAIFLCKMKGG